MIGAGPPPKAGANGNGTSGVQAGSGDGCCDTTIGRGKELMSRVPDCTSESLLEFQKLLFTFSKKTHGYFTCEYYSSNEIKKTQNEHLIIVCQDLISL